jgi:hypothetical protein
VIAAYGLAVFGGAVVCSVFWVWTLIVIHPLTGDTLHRVHVYVAVAAFLMVNATVIVAIVGLPDLVMATFGLAMGLQLVTSVAGWQFARTRR